MFKSVVLIALTVLCVTIVLGGCGTCITAHYRYSCNIAQWLRLADDASDARTKLEYLERYRAAINEKIPRNNARYVFKQTQYTRDAQLKTLDSLIQRLTDIVGMDPKSFEYQTAMQQVTGQEFDHAIDRIDKIFWECYRREGFWRWFWTIPNTRIGQGIA